MRINVEEGRIVKNAYLVNNKVFFELEDAKDYVNYIQENTIRNPGQILAEVKDVKIVYPEIAYPDEFMPNLNGLLSFK